MRQARWIGFVFFALLVLAFSSTPYLEAQLTRGAISGTVRDDSGAVVPGAEVKITQLSTNQVREAVTNDAGFYQIKALEPGIYAVTIGMAGFATTENKSVEIGMNQEVTFDVQLKVAELASVVDVTAEAVGVTVNKTNPTIGLNATSKQILDLPLGAGRDVNNIALLSPNVFTGPGSSGISANGQRARNNNFTIDGADNNDISVTISTTDIVPEAVAEFQVQTNAYNVEFGRNSGAQINVITKQGSNDLHGDLWEYYRGSGLNAMDNVEKRNKLGAPTRFNRNQFGGDLGGRIFRDKTFFFGLFEGDRTKSPGSLGGTVRIPTQKGYQALQSVPLGESQSSQSRQNVLSRLDFLGDVYSLNPVFSSIQNVQVNGVNIETGNTNFSRATPSEREFYLFRVDHILGLEDNLSFKYSMDAPTDANLTSNTQFGSRFAADQIVKDQMITLSETHIMSTLTVNEFRTSYVRRNLGFPEKDPLSPTATISGMFTIGGAANFPQGRVQNSFQFSDILSMHKAKHSLKIGADIRRIQLNNLSAFYSKGDFGFNNLQDYMNNLASVYRQALQTSSFAARQTQQFYFFQDDFRVNPSLTLNLGIRYENSGVPFGFFGATEPEVRAALVPGPVKRDNNNWAPRVGFAFSPRSTDGVLGKLFGGGRSSIRGGYGIAYDILFYNILTVNASNYPRVVTPEKYNVQDVYPNIQTVSGAAKFDPTASFVNCPEDAATPYSQLFSLSFQRELGQDYLWEVGYTGSRSLNGINQLQGNPSILTAAQAATVRDTKKTTSIPTVQQRRIHPEYGSRVLIGTSAQGTYHAGFLRFEKQFSHGNRFGVSYTFSKLMSNNDESLGVADITTGSPQVPQDYLNIGAEKSLSAFDRTHRFVTNYTYQVPWFRGGWAQNSVMKHVFAGWQLSGITSIQSGQPFTILTGVDSNGNGTSGGDRPNLNPNGTLTLDPEHGNFKTFTTSKTDGRFLVPLGTNNLPLAYSLGNGDLGRNTLRAPTYLNWDLNIAKRIAVREGHRLLLRMDLLNAFNQDNFGLPVNSLNSASFGQNTRNWGNRSITLSAKYSF